MFREYFQKIKPTLILIIIITSLVILSRLSMFMICSAIRRCSFFTFLYKSDIIDSQAYISIANNGYDGHMNSGFFPLFPLVLRCFSVLFAANASKELPSLFLNAIFQIVACVFIYKYVMLTRRNKEMAYLSIVLFTFGPWAYLMAVPMTESLFMMLLIMALYSMKKGYYIRMGICGLLLSATKAYGVFFAVVVLVEFIQRYLDEETYPSFTGFFEYCFRDIRLIIGVLLIPWGLFSYMIYCQASFGDGLLFVHIQQTLFSHGYVGYFKTLFLNASIPEIIVTLFDGFICISLITHRKWSEATLPIICYLLVGCSMLFGLPRYNFSCITITLGVLDLVYEHRHTSYITQRVSAYSLTTLLVLLEFYFVYRMYFGQVL